MSKAISLFSTGSTLCPNRIFQLQGEGGYPESSRLSQKPKIREYRQFRVRSSSITYTLRSFYDCFRSIYDLI